MIMKWHELKEYTLEELAQHQREVRQEMFNLRVQQSAGQLERPTRLRELRRDLARVATLMREKK